MIIEDGGGRQGAKATVSAAQRLNVSSKAIERTFYISRDEKRVYNAIMPTFSAAAGQYVFYLKNTSQSRNLFVKHIEFHSLEAVHWKIWEVTGTAADGATITPKNLNLSSGFDAEATCMGGTATITGLTTNGQIGTHRTKATGEGEMTYNGALILGPNKAIAIEYEAGTTGLCEIDCFFWYEDIARAN